MRPAAALLASLTLTGQAFAQPSAWAQNAPIQAAPLQRQWQQSGLPPLQQQPPLQPQPSLQQQPPLQPQSTLFPPAATQAAPAQLPPAQLPPAQLPPAPLQTGQPAPVAPPTTVERPNVWLPATVAKLQALDKVNAQASALTIKVGQSAAFGSLTITVKACVTRPPDQPADAAAYLDVTDSHPDQPGFDGWMLQDEPSISMMQHPIYDLRVSGCS